MPHRDPIALVVLAAGQGKRMGSDLPKVLHRVGHAPLLMHALASAAALAPARVVVVVGHGGAAVEAALRAAGSDATVVRQAERLGTGHAVLQARDALAGFEGEAIVLYGDTPFVRPATLEAMLAARAGGADVVVLGFEAAVPGRYGRLVTEGDRLLRIVEAADATEAERAIGLCNSGVLCARAGVLMGLLARVGRDNAAGEHYLTDAVGLAVADGQSAAVVTCDEAETMGVNDRADLARAETAFQARARAAAMASGATLTAPESVHFSHDTVLGRDVVVEPHVVFGPGVTVADGATIRAFSHLEGATVGEGCTVGPYARLRPGSVLEAGARVGNFVETKAARIGAGAKIPHLSYVGDAEVGARANLGAGTITCNYDGVSKHRTTIGEGAFVGSNAALVAPVRVGAGALVAAGSTVTLDVPDGALAMARARQVNRDGMATRLMRRLRDLRAGGRG